MSIKPIYWHFNGLIDGRHCKYTAVLTPHFLERSLERGARVGDTHFRAIVPKLWEASITGATCGTRIGSSYIYFKRKFNKRRRRWELEFITITPDRVFHTERLKHAVKVTI